MATRKDFATIQIQPPEAPPDEKDRNPYYNSEVVPPPKPTPIDEMDVIDLETTRYEVTPLRDRPTESNVPPRKKRRGKRRLGEEDITDQQLQFSVQDVPPWYLTIILGFQHYLVMFGATVANPLAMSEALCIGNNNLAKSEIISTIFFVSGICTLIQVTLGIRLPIVQGGTFTIVTPSIAILTLEKWKCPENPTQNETMLGYDNSTSNDAIWQPRMREIQGAIMVSSVVQVVIGFTGIMGFLMRFIGPLAIAPTISLAGLALFGVATGFAEKQWWITLVTIILIAAFSQYTKNINIPCFRFERGVGCVRTAFPLFRLFPVILAIAITWALCAILTALDVFPSDPKAWGYGAATNLQLDVLDKAPWFRVPYPGQWGTPTVSAASVFGMLSGILASMIESVGDYYACARMSHAPPPPMHAINRGIGIEGIGCILAGAFGTGSATTSYSENIGAIGITKVASVRVIQVGAAIMMIFGVFGKFGAIFVTIPDPIIGGVFIVMFGMITAVGISNLQFVDLNSSRNLFIIGFSFFFGLTLPEYMKKNRGVINTNVPALDQIITVLLQTNMFVGGLAGFVLDNTIPGTDQERGLIKWREMLHYESSTEVISPEAEEERVQAIYDIPLVTPFLKRKPWTRYIPFLPTFDENILSLNQCCKKRNVKSTKQSEA